MTLPVAQTRARASSTQPCSQLAPCDCLRISSACGVSPQPRNHVSPAQGTVTYQGGGVWRTGRGPGEGQKGDNSPHCCCPAGRLLWTVVWWWLQPSSSKTGHADWSCKLHLEPAASLTGYELCCGSPIGNVRVCQAEQALKSQQGSGGLLGNPELPSSGNRWGFSSVEVSSATFTSSLCTWNLHQLWMDLKRHKDPLSHKCYLMSSNCRFPPSCLLWAKDLFMCLK